MADVKIHVKGIQGSGLVEKGKIPTALFGAVLEVDGHLIQEAFKVEVTFEEGFVEVRPYFTPGTIEIVSHDKETWEEFDKRLREDWAQKTARDGQGRLLAKVE